MTCPPDPGPGPRLDTTQWPRITGRPLLLVPVGSTEQHGPHLPIGTDAMIAQAVATRTATVLPADTEIAVAPTVGYGASGEHEGFAGTVSIGTDVLSALLLEIGRSAAAWAGQIVFVNGHGGNATAVVAAVRRLRFEGRETCWYPVAFPDSDAHAGRTETSVMLHLAPHTVRQADAEAGNTEPVSRLLPALRAQGVRAVSPNGVLGDPSGASAAEGRALVDGAVADLVRRLASPAVDDLGRLLGAEAVAG